MSLPKESTFFILDLDRTIFDTIKATEVMENVVARHNPEMATRLAQKFEESSRIGESFSARDFIVESVGELEMQTIEITYKEVAGSLDLLLPGARELVAYIKSLPGARFGILTYGSPLGQAMKIEAGGLADVPFLVTQETFKGSQVAAWRQNDGSYQLPDELGGGVAASIVFVDDKPFSFKGLPVDCRGYLVKSVYDAGIEMIPSSVQVVDTLSQVIASEKQHRPSS